MSTSPQSSAIGRKVLKSVRENGAHLHCLATPWPLAWWIILCAGLNLAGWVLSAFGQLNTFGYLVVFALGAIGVILCRKLFPVNSIIGLNPGLITKRFRRIFPLAFLALGILAFIGGLLHAPNNYDGLAYRTPRVLNWLAEGRWNWVHTNFQRLNTRSCGFEWITAPLILFTKTDRWEFLINVVSFLFLPGLIFSLFRRLEVRGRTAWHWMWLLPTGYGYLLQAGSSVNDLFGVVFALASIDCALRARQTGRMRELGLSILAAAMMTSAKASNLPLLLPWLAAFISAWRVWLWRPLTLALIFVPALFASILPTSYLNQIYSGDWTGSRVENTILGGGRLGLHIFNNAINLSLNNLEPPIFPPAPAWNRLALQIMPAVLHAQLEDTFETPAARWQLGEMQMEEGAGLGFSLSSLLLAGCAVVAFRRVPAIGSSCPTNWKCWAWLVTPWASLIFVMATIGFSGISRYLLPYYPLLLAALLQGRAMEQLTRKRWWQIWAKIGLLLAAMLIIVSPARPLWPASWFFRTIAASDSTNPSIRRAATVYEVYAQRSTSFEPVLRILPPDLKTIGVLTADDPETSLWRPFGSRRVLPILYTESGDQMRRRGIRYVVVKQYELKGPWPDWLRKVGATEVARLKLRLRAGDEPADWGVADLGASGR